MKNINTVDRSRTIFSYDEVVEADGFYADYSRNSEWIDIEKSIKENLETFESVEENNGYSYVDHLFIGSTIFFLFVVVFGKQIAEGLIN